MTPLLSGARAHARGLPRGRTFIIYAWETKGFHSYNMYQLTRACAHMRGAQHTLCNVTRGNIGRADVTSGEVLGQKYNRKIVPRYDMHPYIGWYSESVPGSTK